MADAARTRSQLVNLYQQALNNDFDDRSWREFLLSIYLATETDTAITAAIATALTLSTPIAIDGVVPSVLKWVDVTCTATLLDASTGTGKIEVAPAATGDSYKIRDSRLIGGGTSFGGAGDRLLSLTDGTTVWTTVPNANLESAPAVTVGLGNAAMPFLTGTVDTASAAGAQIYFQYSGGTPETPHTTGSIKFQVLLEKVA
jgi:hypothetical protein